MSAEGQQPAAPPADDTEPRHSRSGSSGRRSGPVTRRGVLAGVTGLLVGAGVTEGVDRWPRSPAVPRRNASPGEELMTEHGILKRVLLAYRAAAGQLAAGMAPPVGAVVDAAQLISDYIESFHEGLEEAYVFPRVRGQHPDLVRTLLIQHDRGRHLTARISAAGDLDLTRADARSGLRTGLDQFVRMYEPHEAWEDTVVFPALRRALPQRQLDLLAERFADLSDHQYGDAALQDLLDRVAHIEDQLGIGDLAAFTPPERT